MRGVLVTGRWNGHAVAWVRRCGDGRLSIDLEGGTSGGDKHDFVLPCPGNVNEHDTLDNDREGPNAA